MSNVRQRPNKAIATSSINNSSESENMNDDLVQGRGLSAPTLLRSAPSHYGCVLKLHIPLMYKMCPVMVQNWLVRNSSITSLICCAGLIPVWKERYLILLGNYLYSYKDCNALSPKGTPILLKGISNIDVLGDEKHELLQDTVLPALPSGYDSMFCISTFGKTRYYAVSSAEQQAETWVNFVRDGRQEVITRSMGHSNVPLPSSWKYFDTLTKDLVKSRDRIRKRVDDMEQREIEMTGFMESTSPTRGYYS